MARKMITHRGQTFEEFEQEVKKQNHDKGMDEIRSRKEEAELKIQQQNHQLQRKKNLLKKLERKERTHRLIEKGAAVEHACPDTKFMEKDEFQQLANEIFSDTDLKDRISFLVAERKEELEASYREAEILQELLEKGDADGIISLQSETDQPE